MISNVIIEVANCNANGCPYYSETMEDEEYVCRHLSEDGTCTNGYSQVAILASEIEEIIYNLIKIKLKADIDGSSYADTK